MIMMDCPWAYQNDKNKPPYRCLTQKELKLLPIKEITTDDSLLLMWVTGPQKDKAIELIKHYGFTYQQTIFTWIKTKNGRMMSNKGIYSDTSTEELLVASRGNVKRFLRPNHKVKQVQYSEIGPHSKKPDNILKLLPKVFTLEKMSSLEVFARRRVLKDFDLYGDEITPKFQSAPSNQSINVIKHQLSQTEHERRVQVLIELYKQQNKHTKLDQLVKLKKLLHESIGVFAFVKSEFGLTDVLQHHIDLQKDAKPIARKPYASAQKENEFIAKEVEMLLKLDCIEPSSSEWSSSVVLVLKPNGEYRMCIDYRGLNSCTVRDQFPLPRIDYVLTTVCTGKIFSKLDLKSGFWQVSVCFKDRPKTSFVCKQGTYQWKRMPFGLTNAPATFQRLMEKVLKPFLDKFCLVYIDDVIIYSQTVEEHLVHLQMIMEALDEANLKLGHDKCVFLQDRIQILRHEVQYGSYTPLDSRVEAITKLKCPTDVKGIQIFLGLVNYHGQFIPNLAKIAKPLRQLTKKNVPFVWELSQQKAFEQLKQIVATKPILHIPMPGKIMILYTDFSEQGIGAVLSQQVDDRNEKVIEYASRTLKKHEINYPAYKGEVLAVKWALQKFRQYLLQAPFKLILDNEAAVSLLKQRKSPYNLNSLQKAVLNWVLDMSEFEFEPIHRPGSSHNNADALSRLETIKDEQFNYFNWWGHDPDGVCIKCLSNKTTQKNDVMICDYCGKLIHQTCHKPKVETIPQGPWYCAECVSEANQLEYPDVTLDFYLQDLLKGRPLPDHLSQAKKDWITERSQQYYYDRQIIRTKNSDLKVPTITERVMLLSSTHDLKGHCSADALYETLKQEYFWEGMKRDISKLVSSCFHCSQMNPKYIPNPYLHPTEKGDRPMAILHVDLSGDLQTHPTSHGNRYLMIIVDAFSKWVEIYTIPNKQAITTCQCLWDHVKTYGSPSIVRSDQGTEFKGEFTSLLSDLRVEFIKISTSNPQANGQAERTIKTVKNVLRKFVNSPTQKVEWDEAATAVQLSLNSTPSQTTGFSPYEILFGRPMAYPSSVVIDPPLEPGLPPTDQQVQKYVYALKDRLRSFHPQVRKNISEADLRNKRLYDKRHQTDALKQQTFQNGDYVMIRIPKVTKLGPKGKGPFIFIKYTSKDKLTSLLLDPTKAIQQDVQGTPMYTSKTFTYSTSNLAKVKVDPSQFDLKETNFD